MALWADISLISDTFSCRFCVFVLQCCCSHQNWESVLFIAWLGFGSVMAFSAQCEFIIGVTVSCFAICDQIDIISE